MTPARRLSRASLRRSRTSRGASAAWCRLPFGPRAWAALPCAVGALAWAPVLAAQVRGDAPIAPAATIGPVTDASTLSVLGIAAIPDGTGNPLAQRNDVWLGATQPIGRIGRVRFAALGTGTWRLYDGVGADGSLEGTVALRARARVGAQRIWSAVSYGHASVSGNPTTDILSAGMPAGMNVGDWTLRAVDTTVSRRVDVGAISRAEAGVVTNMAGMELSLGFSVERATRTTTQTLTVDESDAITLPASMPGDAQLTSRRTTRSLQRRDIATGIASLGFETGPTTGLVSVTAPVATWISQDALTPVPGMLPTVASLAVVQPVTAWLSLVGAAATNTATVGGTALRDELDTSRRRFAPVVALGVRIARLPTRGNDGTPRGILAFETRTMGAVDAMTVADGVSAPDGDTLRVVLLIDAPRAESVELMGDATDWTVTPLRRMQSGRWRAELKLAPGVHRVTVRADGGAWIAPPGLPIGNDDYGSPVGMIVVRGKRN